MHVKDRDSAGPRKKRVVVYRRTVVMAEIVVIGEFYCASNSKVRLKRMFVYPKP